MDGVQLSWRAMPLDLEVVWLEMDGVPELVATDGEICLDGVLSSAEAAMPMYSSWSLVDVASTASDEC